MNKSTTFTVLVSIGIMLSSCGIPKATVGSMATVSTPSQAELDKIKADASAKAKADSEAEHAKIQAEFEKTQKEVEQTNKINAEAAAKAQSDQQKDNSKYINGSFTLTGAKLDVGDYGIVYITGSVHNDTDKDKQYVMVQINLYDQDGNQVGSTQDAVTSLDAKGTWKFKAPVLDKKTASFKVKAITSL